MLSYRLDPAKATLTPNEPPFARTPPGAGPRHLTFAPSGKHVYVINEIIKKFKEQGRLAPKYHALTRPTIAEAEGVHRAIALAEMAETPVYIVHLSCSDALNQVRQARDRGIPAFAATVYQRAAWL